MARGSFYTDEHGNWFTCSNRKCIAYEVRFKPIKVAVKDRTVRDSYDGCPLCHAPVQVHTAEDPPVRPPMGRPKIGRPVKEITDETRKMHGRLSGPKRIYAGTKAMQLCKLLSERSTIAHYYVVIGEQNLLVLIEESLNLLPSGNSESKRILHETETLSEMNHYLQGALDFS